MAKDVIKQWHKCGIWLAAALLLTVTGYAQLSGNQTLSFRVEKGWQLDKVLVALSRRSGVNITFNPREVKQVSVPAQQFTQATLTAIIEKILAPTAFTWQLQNSRLVVFSRRVAPPAVAPAPAAMAMSFTVAPVSGNRLVSGVVRSEEGKPMAAATIRLPQLNQFYATDTKGQFVIQVPAGQEALVLEVVYVGYKTQSIELPVLSSDTLLPDILLKEVSLRLKDISVTAGRNFEGSSNSSLIISREMIEQTPALSLNDLLNQLPNKAIAPPSLQNVQNLNLRSVFQAQDKGAFQLNNAFGIAIVMDGNTLSNNLNMQSFNPGRGGVGSSFVKSGNTYGLSGSGTTAYTGDYTFGGIDLRQISPDNIESIEVVAGVASAKYGDLSEGAVIVERQAGVSKGYFRTQLRDNATSYSFSRGFKLSNTGSALNASVNYVSSYADARDKLKAYRRINSNIIYTTYLGKTRKLKMTTIADYGRNLDGIKKDPDDVTATRVKFDNWNAAVSNKLNYRVNGRFIKDISLNLRYSHSHQYSYREEFVNKAYILYTTGMQTGLYEGFYDKGIYTAVSIIDGRPVNATGSLDITAGFRTGEVHHFLSFGGSYNWGKNLGKGQLSDPNMPRTLAASGTSSTSPELSDRYYDFRRAIAQQDMGVYAEDVFRLRVYGRNLNIRSGVRLDVQNGFITGSPRININYEISRQLRVGLAYGIAYKSPGLAQRYPGPVFNEITLLNSYNGKVAESQNLIYVYRYDPVNDNLHSSRNQTLELSAQYRRNGFSLAANIYSKWARNGINTIRQIEVVDLPQYTATWREGMKPLVTQTGTKKYRLNYYTFGNTLSSNSQGIELMATTPAIKAIATSFAVSTGFTRTWYLDKSSRVDDGAADATMVNIPQYASIGFYPPEQHTSYFSSGRISSITHIPRISLMVQFTAECSFIQKTVREASQGIPFAYYNNAQEYVPIKQFDRTDPMYGHLYMPESELNAANVPKMIMNYHLSVGKEIRKKFRLSFNVYNVFNYQPYYVTSSGTYQYPNAAPTFGAELSVKL